MIPRFLEHTIRRALKTFPVVLVTGPRQSGKTTLLKNVWGRSFRYVSLENPDVRMSAKNDPNMFLRMNEPPLILDEIQYLPELLSYIKTSVDENRAPGRFIITGSQSFPLMRDVSQSLAGRVAVLNLLPLSLGELMLGKAVSVERFLNFGWLKKRVGKKKPPRTAVFILRGSYPEPCVSGKVDRKLWCSSYIQTYIERDLRNLVNVADLASFERFLVLCAARTGRILNMSDLSRDVGVSVPTIKGWLSALEASFQIRLVQPFYKNFGKRMIKAPKIYFMDTAIASFLLGIHDAEAAINGPASGQLFETLVFSELLKLFVNNGEPPAIYYYRSGDGLEIDFLIERNGKIYPIEAKFTATPLPGHADGIRKWMALAGKEATVGLVVTDASSVSPLGGNVFSTPWHQWAFP